ncbi:24625_t:CDS:2, partial [Gigaspora margarita]
CGILGTVQIIQEYDSDPYTGSSVYVKKSVCQQLHVLMLYISGALLFIELVYRTFITFAQATDSTNRYEWMIYVFEATPELVLLVILGGIILGDWFYNEDPVLANESRINDPEIVTTEEHPTSFYEKKNEILEKVVSGSNVLDVVSS